MKRTVSLLALLAALCCLFTASAAAADAPTSGTCGENLTWALDGAGTLTIAGEGAMEEFYYYDAAPWSQNRDSIKTVVIENGVTTIGSYAFRFCESLTSITLPESVTLIGESAFYNCRSLTSVTIPAGVTTIGSEAFRSCSSLTDVSITDLDAWCRINFGNPYATPMCYAQNIRLNGSKIASVTVPEGVTELKYTFYGFKDLIRVTLPKSLTGIGATTFYNCTSLTSVTIPEGVTSIGSNAFSWCSSLTSVTIPESVTSIGYDAFSWCSSLTGITIPESVTSIGESAFYQCTALTSVTIPKSVTNIGESAFYRCASLTSVTFSGDCQLTTVGKSAFDMCGSLTDVSITNMDAWCRIDFDGRTATPMCYAKNIRLNGNKIASVTVPERVTELKYTFYGFKDLIRVTLPKSLTGIGEKTFYKCTSLISITIPDGVTAIGDRACSGCTSLASVTIPASVTSIGDGAFEDCSGLTSVTIPEGVATIGIGAFKECCNLVNVTIPDSVTAIGKYAFMYCGSLTSITLPEGLTAINDWVFSGCHSLTSMTIPDSVISIGDSAFWNCGLTSVTIPQSVTTIGGSAFANCSDLTDVYISDLDAWCRIEFANGFASPFYYAKNLYLNGALVESLEIPGSVSVVQAGLFRNATCLKRVSIPRSLAGVAANAFENCTNITEVFYEGSESEWAALPISAGNDPLKNAQVYFNSTLDNFYCRITVAVSDGGRVTVDHTTAKAGETVTVTAVPYQGYELAAICVDGAAIEGNTFAVTGNHVVSARFTRVPVTGGTEDFRLEGLSVRTAAGEELQELPQGSLLVTVAVRHLNENGSGTILLAQYDSLGRYRGLMWLTLDEMPQGMTLRVTLPVDNSSGEIANLKVFVVEDLTSPLPVGTPVSFGQV